MAEIMEEKKELTPAAEPAPAAKKPGKSPADKKKRRRLIRRIIALIVVIALIAGGVVFFKKKGGASSEVGTGVVEYGSITSVVDGSGLIDALAPGAEGPAVPAAATALVDNGAKAGNAAPRTIRLSVDLLDRMMSGVSDLVLARNELARRLRDTSTDVAVAIASPVAVPPLGCMLSIAARTASRSRAGSRSPSGAGSSRWPAR